LTTRPLDRIASFDAGNGRLSSELGRFHLLTVDDLLRLPPLTWLLDRYLPASGLAVLYGPPGAGKSFLALLWSMLIAAGRAWIGHQTQRGSVVFVAAEGGSGLGQRAAAIRDAHEIGDGIGIRFLREPVNLLAPRDVDELLAASSGAALERLTLFAFDTMARCMAGGDENSAQDVGRVIGAADRIRRETGAAVLLLHHTGKDGLAERGSSALRGAADAMFSLKAEENILTLECSKQKDAPAVALARLRLVSVGPSCVIEPDEATASGPGLTKVERIALEALHAVAQSDGATVSEWLAGTAHGRNSQLANGSFYRARKRLLDLGLVRRELKSRRYSLSDSGLDGATPNSQ
jgi:hypothetical protein